MSEGVVVRHRYGEYPVRFTDVGAIRRELGGGAFVVTDENVFTAWGGIASDPERVLVLPPGESTKSMAMLERVLRWLACAGADRGSTMVAFGGGVIGDLAGLAAAIYMRGVACVQAPTTLLAQVDSSVGGKVAVDLPEGKNLAGAFYPPKAVLVATETLRTLPEREFRGGLAEVWKYGFALDADLASTLRGRSLVPDDDRLADVISRCIDLKRRVVEEDELDETGRRAVLNFGHTIGHAIEQASGYEGVLHGEAVAIGMAAEAAVGEALGVTESGVQEEIRVCLLRDGLPAASELFARPHALIEAMARDKKASDGRIAMSLPTRIGECRLVRDVPAKVIEEVLGSL